MYILDPKHAKAHREGDIHIHDLDFLTLTTTCCQIDLDKLFTGGFSTGHGFLREPNDISSYSALACIAIQSNQNDQHGGQSIPNFDYAMAKGVQKTYRRVYRQNLARALELVAGLEDGEALSGNPVRCGSGRGRRSQAGRRRSLHGRRARVLSERFDGETAGKLPVLCLPPRQP